MHAIILAGGRGRRLAPYTICFPKPLVPGDVVLTEEDFRRLGEDVHEELMYLLRKIRLLV